MARAFCAVALFATLLLSSSSNGNDVTGLTYTYRTELLKTGQSLGNEFCYVTLNGTTDLLSDRTSVRYGLRESTNQRYYLLGWDLQVTTPAGHSFEPVTTKMTPAYQESELKSEGMTIHKSFFVPLENGYLRSAHFLLGSDSGSVNLTLHSHMVFPEGTQVEQSDFHGHAFVLARYADGTLAVVWGSVSLSSLDRTLAGGKSVDVTSNFDWKSQDHRQCALSFAYVPKAGDDSLNTLLNAVVDLWNGSPTTVGVHLFRVQKLLDDSVISLNRYLNSARFQSPDPVVNRGYAWAKINQVRMQQAYRWGEGFSNNPPSDFVVGRDSYWYLTGSSYYTPLWSRKLLNLWSKYGLEPSGKYIEYMTAARAPIFKDDYGLNINDNTPLLMLAAYRYYCLTGDRNYLQSVYPSLIGSANYILAQTKAGEQNRFGLVWCTSKETFVRGLCSWRNVIRGYNLSGAVTEINSECYEALARTAELAKAEGDEPNQLRLQSAAQNLRQAIESHLRCSTASNHYYYLNIDPEGRPVTDLTADLLFPVLCGVSDAPTGRAISQTLFGEDFWASTKEGAGGIRTVSPVNQRYQPRENTDSYGLMGGVWPNLALWAGKAAATVGLPDLTLKGLKATLLLSEPEDPAGYNVVPGEFPEYFNGDDLVQRGMPLSPFVAGIYIWDALEGIMGVTPHPSRLEVNPAIPPAWKWVAVTNMIYRGFPLSLLAVPGDKALYTTAPVETRWRQILVPAALQDRYSFEGSPEAFWMVVPNGQGKELLAASPTATSGKLVERDSGRVLLQVSIGAGELIKKAVPGTRRVGIRRKPAALR